jgi:putrescine transport system permease protein
MIGTVLSAQFVGARNWPVAGAVAIVLLLVLLLPILLFQRYQRRELEAARR